MQKFIDQHVQEIAPLEKASYIAWWNLATTGDQKYAKISQEANVAYRKIYSSKEDYKKLLTLSSNDPLLNRQKTLLIDRYIENQISPEQIEEIVKLETEIEAIYTTFRPLVDGKPLSNNDLKEILTKSNDSDLRKEAWDASKLIGEQVEKKVLKLVKLRNESARQNGFSNYYTMKLKVQELEEPQLFALVDELDELTQPQWKTYKTNLDKSLAQKFGLQPAQIMPWHYQDPFFQEAPQEKINLDHFYTGKDPVAISANFYKKIGLPVEDILQRSDLYERENKNQHAFCICIDRGQDVRILCNIRENEYWMATQLHELGHAVYDKNIDQKLPFILRTYPHISTTEAIAMLFGRFNKFPEFLEKFCSVPQKEIDKVKNTLQQQMAATLLVFARWAMVMISFERELYQQENANLNKIWWDLVEKYQNIKRIPNRDKPDWAAKLHLACAPVYYQNYLIGELTASQLLHHLNKKTSNKICTSEIVGKTLTTGLFQLGAQYPWDQTIEKATGESLNPHYFSLDISGA